MVLQAANAGYKVLGPNLIFIYEDAPEKKKRVRGYSISRRSISQPEGRFRTVAEVLKSSMEIKTLVANNDLGTIQVRDTRDTMDVVEKLIAAR